MLPETLSQGATTESQRRSVGSLPLCVQSVKVALPAYCSAALTVSHSSRRCGPPTHQGWELTRQVNYHWAACSVMSYEFISLWSLSSSLL